MNLPIERHYIPRGRANRPAKSNPCLYITLHNTGNARAGADARSHAAYLKTEAAARIPVSWHYTVDDGCLVQHLPDRETAYHAGDGDGRGNCASIGIEICEQAGIDLPRATDLAAQLTARLCERYGIPMAHVVQHHHWSGKDCPRLLRAGTPYDWAAFLSAVERHARAGDPSPWADQAWRWAVDKGITDGSAPQDPCTREMAVTLLHRAAGCIQKELQKELQNGIQSGIQKELQKELRRELRKGG